MARVPREFKWLFPNVDFRRLDTDKDEVHILSRILEFGRLVEVRWVIATYGYERIHAFFRDVGHPEMSDRTLAFWRAVFNAEGETWAKPPDWRKSRIAPWVS